MREGKATAPDAMHQGLSCSRGQQNAVRQRRQRGANRLQIKTRPLVQRKQTCGCSGRAEVVREFSAATVIAVGLFWAAHRSAALACPLQLYCPAAYLPTLQRFQKRPRGLSPLDVQCLYSAYLNTAFASEPPGVWKSTPQPFVFSDRHASREQIRTDAINHCRSLPAPPRSCRGRAAP